MQFLDNWDTYERVNREGFKTRAALAMLAGIVIVAINCATEPSPVEPAGPAVIQGTIVGGNVKQDYYPPEADQAESLADRFEREARAPVKQLAPESEGAHTGYNDPALQRLITRLGQ